MKERELVFKRKPREKHFLKEDGSLVVKMFDSNIHYKKDGKYEEIDNSLVDNEFYIENKSNSYKIKFNKQITDNMIDIISNDVSLKIDLRNKKNILFERSNKGSKLKQTLKYRDIMDGIDIEYNILPSKIKESIIINDLNYVEEKIEFKLDTNIELFLNSDGSISGTNKGNYYIIETPYMFDENGVINKNIHYNLQKYDGYYVLSLNLDEEWLRSPIRKYPVTIDPTITLKGDDDSITVWDTYIYYGDTYDFRYMQDVLKAGVERINNSDTINRALLQFDLPELATGSQIIDAKLRLVGYQTTSSVINESIVEVHRVTENWSESGANWNNMYNKFDSRIESCFVSSRSILNSNIINARICVADITDLVKRWYTDTYNFGIMLKQNDETYLNENYPAFYSRDNSINGDENPMPVLEITYRNQNGLEKYMKYIQQNISLGFIYENVYNGNMVTVLDLCNTPSTKLPAVLKLIYNTNDVILKKNTGCGIGFQFNYYQTIKEQNIDNKKYLAYTDEDGTIHYFNSEITKYNDSGYLVTTTKDNTYYDEDGLEMTIFDDINNNKYILQDKNGNVYEFLKSNDISRLIKIISIEGYSINISYDSSGKITKIIDEEQNEININYSSNIISISTINQNIKLTLDNQRIIGVETNIGNIFLNYNDHEIIDYIIDINGKKYLFDYYDQIPYRIKKITEYGLNNELGHFIELSYNNSSTTITDNMNRITTLTFNNFGNICSSTNLPSSEFVSDACGKVDSYGENYQDKNKLLSVGIPIKYVKNYIKNSSFEDSIVNLNKTNNILFSRSQMYSKSGLYSLEIICNAPNEQVTGSMSLKKGKTYTYSAYIKNNIKVQISLCYYNQNNILVEELSEIIEPSDNFERYDVTIEYPNNAISELMYSIKCLEQGLVYADDLQLEIGDTVNSYNYIENSDFSENLDGWNTRAFYFEGDEMVDVDNRFDVVDLADGSKALKIKMHPVYRTSLSKGFNVSGLAGDSYTISFWYKNEGYRCFDEMSSNHVIINFEYPYGQGSFPSFELNPNREEWQYFSYTFIAQQEYSSIYLSIFQTFNANNLYITNLCLFKNVKKQSYYNDYNGNIYAIKNVNDSITYYEYDLNNQLIKTTDSRGKKLMFEYDNTFSNRMLSGITDTGIANVVKYNENGKPIFLRTQKIYDSSLEDGLYKIRLKGTSKYFSMKNGKLHINDTGNNIDYWTIENLNISNKKYIRIKHPVINNMYITNVNGIIDLAEYNENNSLFEFEYNNNNSIKLKCKSNNKNLFVNDLNKIELIDFDLNNENRFEFYFEKKTSSLFMEDSLEYNHINKHINKVENTLMKNKVFEIEENTGLIKSISTSQNDIIKYFYNNKNQLIKIDNNGDEINYIYNVNNLLSSIVHDDVNYNFEYDNFGNLNKIRIGNQELLQNTYTENNGNLTKTLFGNNQIISYNYDEYDRLLKVIKETDNYTYKYDNFGSLVKIISTQGILKYVYDECQRLVKCKYNDFKINYQYDSENNIIKKEYGIKDNITKIINNYDVEGNLVNFNFDNDNNIIYQYDELGRITLKILSDNYFIKYEYVTHGKRTSSLIKRMTINNNDVYSYKYDYEEKLTHIYHNDVLEVKYIYDERKRLCREDNFVTNETTRYKYDENNNMIFRKTYEINTYNIKKSQINSYDNNNWKDQMTSINGNLITYDNVGNLLKVNDKSFIWKDGKTLYQYSDNNKTITYKYNHDGIRTEKNINGIKTEYFVESNRILLEKTENNILEYIYNASNDLIGFKLNKVNYFYEKNIFNDIIKILDSNYNMVARYYYDGWGKIIKICDNSGNDITNDLSHIANINPFRYRGYYYDKETGLYYLNSRYYSPEFCRFISADFSFVVTNNPQELNLYIYAINDPINYTDQTGNWSKLDFKVIKAFVTAGVQKIKNWVSEKITKTSNKAEVSGNVTKKEEKVSGKSLGVSISSYEVTNYSTPTVGKVFNVYSNVEKTTASDKSVSTAVNVGVEFNNPLNNTSITINFGNDDNYIGISVGKISLAWGTSISNDSVFVSYTQESSGNFDIGKAYETRMDISSWYLRYAYGYVYAKEAIVNNVTKGLKNAKELIGVIGKQLLPS